MSKHKHSRYQTRLVIFVRCLFKRRLHLAEYPRAKITPWDSHSCVDRRSQNERKTTQRYPRLALEQSLCTEASSATFAFKSDAASSVSLCFFKISMASSFVRVMTLCFQLDGFLEPVCLMSKCAAESIVGVAAGRLDAFADAALLVLALAAVVDAVELPVGLSHDDVCVLSFQ